MDTWTPRNSDNQVATVIVTACRNEKWRDVLGSCQYPTYVVCHQADYLEASAFPAVKLCTAWHGPFAWGPLAGMMMRSVTEPWVMFLHDDVVSPSADGMAAMLEVAGESGSPIVVPAVKGDTRCARQAMKLEGWSHLTEILTDACVLVSREFYEKTDGFPVNMPGTSFELPWLQLKLYTEGGCAAVAHDVVVSHAGSRTFAEVMSIEERRRSVAMAVKWAVDRMHLPSDYAQRIGIPRLVRKDSGSSIATRYTKHLLVGGVRVAITGAESRSQIVELLVNHAPTDSVEYEGHTYRRFGRGDKFVAVERKSTFKIGAHNRLGFGDTFFMMKLFACIKDNYPDAEIEVHTDIQNGDLFQRCKDVDRVVRSTYDKMGKDGIDIHRFGAFGIENAPQNLAVHFGLQYQGQPPQYVVWPEDDRQATIVFDSHGRDREKPLLAVQAHGGWKAKRWAHTAQIIRQANRRGWQVWLIGIDDHPRLRVGDDVIRTGPLALPVVLACLAQCDAIVGFDSGAVHAAAAVGLPSVSLWGPHDPRYILLDAKVYNTHAVRKRNPWADCGKDNCRSAHGGCQCPLKNGGPGAVCIDEVSTHEVWRLVEDAIGTKSAQQSA